ncbi:MAG: radical SAM protein [Desulfuromonadaceae bacterium]|nr:radical SAM protein [Desulfuromonadaceae bacterium]
METLRKWELGPPKTLTIAITGTCNLACRHCWVEAGVLSAPAHVPARILRRLIREFAALGGEGLRFTGGEPLCHPEWLELMRYSRENGFQTLSLQTNGMLFRGEHMTALRELDFPGLSIQISLDGATAATHDLVRGTGAFTGTLDGILKLVQEGLAGRISLFITEMRHNLEEIPLILEFADSMGINSVSSGAILLCGRAAEGAAVFPPDTEQYLRLLERFDRDLRFRELYRRIGRVAALEWRAGEAARPDCCTFIENPYLTPFGRLYPCVMCHSVEYSVTGVFDKGLAASFVEGAPLWSSLLQLSRSRAEAIPECRDCPGKLCCAGGCMGRAWGSCGNVLGADDRCGVRRAIYHHS